MIRAAVTRRFTWTVGSRELRLLAAVALALASLILAGPAPAATQSQYPTDAQARDFNGGDGGWTVAAVYSGAGCGVPGACPTVNPSYVVNGGSDGQTDGFIRTKLEPTAVAMASAGSSVWESPTFKYEAGSARPPSSLTFEYATRADVSALADGGASVTYRVDLSDEAKQASPLNIASGTVGSTSGWTTPAPVGISPAAVAVGHVYRIRIITTFATGAGSVPAGTVDYDDVVLAAGRQASGRGGILGKRTVLTGRKLYVNVFCSGSAERSCRIKLAAYLEKGGERATRRKTMKVRAGKRKRIALKVKASARRKLARRDKVLVKQVVRLHGERSQTKLKRLELRHR
jgi:hypothetical protein